MPSAKDNYKLSDTAYSRRFANNKSLRIEDLSEHHTLYESSANSCRPRSYVSSLTTEIKLDLSTDGRL